MRTLFLSGHGISMRVENTHLMIRDGCEFERAEPATCELKPKHDEYDNIVVFGHSGNISLEAIKWLSKQNIQLTVLNWDGGLLTNILIPEPKAGGVRLAQYQAYSGKMLLDVAKKLIDAKIRNSVHVLDWLCQRHPELREEKRECFTELGRYQSQLPQATTVAQVRGVEGMVAKDYWAIASHVIDKKHGFEGRVFGKTGRTMDAVYMRSAVPSNSRSINNHYQYRDRINIVDDILSSLREAEP
jgi:CRISP-associated protein Cas1